MRQLTTIELTWRQVEEKMEEILLRILGVGFDCSTTRDDTDFWGVKFGGSRLSIEQVDAVCNYVNATLSERKDAYPSEKSEETVGDFGVDIANKLLALSLGITFKKFLVQDDCLLLIDCTKSEKILIRGESITFDTLKSKNELLEYLYANGANEHSLLVFATDYEEHRNNGLFWNVPIKNKSHLGAFFVVVREGILYLPYDDADKVHGAIFNFDGMKLSDRATAVSYLRKLQYDYNDTQDRMSDICQYLSMKENNDDEEKD